MTAVSDRQESRMSTEPKNKYQILRPVRIRRGEFTVAISAAKAQCLFAVLRMRADRTMPTGLITEELSGRHPPRTAGTALHVYVSRLRTILSAGAGSMIVNQVSAYRAERHEEAVEQLTAALGAQAGMPRTARRGRTRPRPTPCDGERVLRPGRGVSARAGLLQSAHGGPVLAGPPGRRARRLPQGPGNLHPRAPP